MSQPDSIFDYYRRLIRLRNTYPVIVHGRYDIVSADDPAVYAFSRTLGDDRLLVILSITAGTPGFALPDHLLGYDPALLIGNYQVEAGEDARGLTLRPFGARVYRFHDRNG